MSTNADKWIDGEISLGKLLQLEGCQRPSGDDLAGAIANSFRERITIIGRNLEADKERARADYEEAKKHGKTEDMAAEAALIRAFTQAQNHISMQFGPFLNP
jgi:hypothetical protein